jgi:hypothetical protein
MSKSRTKKDPIDARVERAYYATCSGIQVSIMDLGSIFRVGRALALTEADDGALGAGIRDFVETIRKN